MTATLPAIFGGVLVDHPRHREDEDAEQGRREQHAEDETLGQHRGRELALGDVEHLPHRLTSGASDSIPERRPQPVGVVTDGDRPSRDDVDEDVLERRSPHLDP